MTTHDAIMTFIIEDLSFRGSSEELAPSTPLLENEVVDSMGILQIIGFIEDEFGIEVDEDEVSAENFATVNDIAGLVERKQSAQ